MLSLRRLNLDNMEVKNVAHILHESNGVILEYSSLDNFKSNFSKYFLALADFKDKIKAIYSLKDNTLFENDVYIISKLEDKLNIPIETFFIDAQKTSEIHDLAEFYFDDLNDGSFELNIVTCPNRNPITILEWILMSNINCGINMAIDMKTINPIWMKEEELFNSIYSYVNSFVYEEYIQVIK